jgi:hypothetical protein
LHQALKLPERREEEHAVRADRVVVAADPVVQAYPAEPLDSVDPADLEEAARRVRVVVAEVVIPRPSQCPNRSSPSRWPRFGHRSARLTDSRKIIPPCPTSSRTGSNRMSGLAPSAI